MSLFRNVRVTEKPAATFTVTCLETGTAGVVYKYANGLFSSTPPALAVAA